MKNLILLIALIVTSEAMAVCTSPVSRTNFSPLTVLTSTKLNSDLNTLYTQVNELPGDCLTNETVTSAKITDGTIVNADIANGTVTNSKFATANTVLSDSASFTTTSATLVDVTNLSVEITTIGRPVEVSLVSSGATEGFVGGSGVSGPKSFKVAILRGATVVSYSSLSYATGTYTLQIPPSSFRFIETLAAGTYTYKVQALSTDSGILAFTNVKLMAREL